MGTEPHKKKTQLTGRHVPKICLLCLAFLILQPAEIETPFNSNAPAQKLSLIVGKSIERKLFAGETHSYTFQLPEQRFLQIDFYSPNVDLLVSIIYPGGEKSLEWNIFKRGTTPIAAVFDPQGVYLLEVQSLETNSYSGLYRMEIKTSRPVATQDQKQVDACRHLSNAVHFRRQWTKVSLKSAIAEYEEALRFWKDLGNLKQEAVVLKNTGDICEMITEWQKALSCYEKAQAIYSQTGDLFGETEVMNALSILCINRGEYRKALDIYPATPSAVEDTWQKAQRLHNFGAAHYELGEMRKATDYLNQALTLREFLQDRAGQADTLLNLAYVNHAAKNLSAAEQYYRQSIDAARSANHPRAIAWAQAALGHLLNISGERQQALEYYDQSLKIFKDIGDISGQCMALEGVAYMYAGLGENEKAIDYYRKTLNLSEQVPDFPFEGNIRLYLSDTYRELGDYENALQHSQKAVRVYESISSPLGESYALASMGKVLEALGKRNEADTSYVQALDLSRKAGDRFLEGFLLDALGHLYHDWDHLQTAQEYYRRALSVQKEVGDYVQLPTTLYNLARNERDLGDLDRAMEHAGQSLEFTESLRTKVASPELRGSYLASVHQQYELMIDLLMQLRSKHPSGQLEAEALQISEQARARSLLDILVESQADIREGVDPDLLEQERSLRKLLNAKANQQMQVPEGKGSEEERNALAEEIDAIVAKYQEVQSRIRSKSPHYADLTQPRILDLYGIQQLVDEETLLLEYELAEERSYFWVVTPTTIESHILPKRIEIEKRVHRVRELMLERQKSVEETGMQYGQRIKEADTEYWKEAADLSQILLGPVSDQLASRRLLIVPDGILQYLPFGALPEPHSARNDPAKKPQPLIMEHEIVNLPSASVLGLLQQETGERSLPPKKVVVLADPVFEADDPRIRTKVATMKQPDSVPLESSMDSGSPLERTIRERGGEFSRLPGTRDEADSIMGLVAEGSGRKLLGFEANLTVASGSELGQYQVVHFGTHGFIDDNNPELSCLVLSLFDEQGHPQDGYLRLHDIYNLKLPVELVVLSACDSALGKKVRGEGLVGIVRGFMYAGAKRIMASLWKVDDKPTAELMKRFYQHLLQDGVTPARALQLAQLEMLNQQRWHAPYYWAAFILQGEWN